MEPCEVGVLEWQRIVNSHQLHEHVGNNMTQIPNIAHHVILWHNLVLHLRSSRSLRWRSEIRLGCGNSHVSSGTLTGHRTVFWSVGLRVASQSWLWRWDMRHGRSRILLLFD